MTRCQCGGRRVFRFITQEFECVECGSSTLAPNVLVDLPDPKASNFVPDGDDYSGESNAG